MSVILQCLAALFASAFFGELLRQPRSTIPYTALIGLNGYIIYLLMAGSTMAFFTAALVVGLLCELTGAEDATVVNNDPKPGRCAEDLARWAGTIPYEILTNINTRVPRVYVD